MKKKRFLTLFPLSQNVHLAKDVGMIPFILHKYEGYDATIACYKIGEYPYLEREVKGLKIAYIDKTFGNIVLDGLWFLLKNYRRFDILMCFHMVSSSLLWLYMFKLLKGGKGKSYLKLDANLEFLKINFAKDKWGKILKILLKKVDLITVETEELCSRINERNEMRVKYLPNGFYDNGIRKEIVAEEKEHLIITVGRIGDKNKSNEVLCEAFAIFSPQHPDWKLKLIGPIEDVFVQYINEYYVRFPQLRDKVEFTGKIEDKGLLNEYYKRARLFVLTSQSESFAIVLLEALQHGCYIVTTDITSAKDITWDQKLGKIFPFNNSTEAISLFMNEFAQSDYKLEQMIAAQNFVYEKFYWPKIAGTLNRYIMNLH